MEVYHNPVLLESCIDALKIVKDGVYVDATFGGGGHSKAILSKLGKSGRLLAFDQDKDAINNIQKDSRFTFIHHNFRFLKRFLNYYGFSHVNGILADLGISSHQIDQEQRGFSTRWKNSKLDMRMDEDASFDALEVFNTYEETALNRIFKAYGELKQSRQISKRLIRYRTSKPITKVNDIYIALDSMVAKGKENRFFAQVFQSVRIEVNKELEVLEEFLKQTEQVLKPGGRLVVLSYHSLEDRMVKRFIRNGFNISHEVLDVDLKWALKALNTKPLLADIKETESNPRARSAKLRIAEKINNG